MNTGQHPYSRWRASGSLRIHDPLAPPACGDQVLRGEEVRFVSRSLFREGSLWVCTGAPITCDGAGAVSVTLAYVPDSQVLDMLHSVMSLHGGYFA